MYIYIYIYIYRERERERERESELLVGDSIKEYDWYDFRQLYYVTQVNQPNHRPAMAPKSRPKNPQTLNPKP